MNFTIAVVRAELYTRNNAHAQRLTRNRRKRNSRKRVMIGECKRSKPRLVRRGDNCIWRERTIGCRRVGMKIDERRRSRGVAALSHRA